MFQGQTEVWRRTINILNGALFITRIEGGSREFRIESYERYRARQV